MSLFRSLLLCTLFATTLQGKLEDHLKRPTEKTNLSKMRNIDFIYLINLDERPERFKRCTDQLHPYEIYPYRFPAVNGWKLSFEAINDVGVQFTESMDGNFYTTSYSNPDLTPCHEPYMQVGRTYFCHCLSKGAIGIALSHLSILQDAYNSGYETIWVMEDDIEVLQNPQILPDLIERLDSLVGEDGWDILFTDQDMRSRSGTYVPCRSTARRPNFQPDSPSQYALSLPIDDTFILKGARYGAHSMIIRRSGMRKILNFTKKYKIYLPYDMDYILPPDIKMYSLRYDLVSNQPGSTSDNGAPNYSRN